MEFELHSFTQEGHSEFSKLFDLGMPDAIPAKALKLAQNKAVTVPLGASMKIELPAKKIDLGRAVFNSIQGAAALSPVDLTPYFWDWLSARLMQALLDSEDGRVGSKDRWVLNSSTTRSYRHLVSGPFFSYASHQDDPSKAMAIMCQGVTVFGDLNEQVAASRAIAGSVGVELATRLYFDENTGATKSGSSAKALGGVRRMVAFLNQIQRTVDFKSMNTSELVKMLPREFDRFI